MSRWPDELRLTPIALLVSSHVHSIRLFYSMYSLLYSCIRQNPRNRKRQQAWYKAKGFLRLVVALGGPCWNLLISFAFVESSESGLSLIFSVPFLSIYLQILKRKTRLIYTQFLCADLLVKFFLFLSFARVITHKLLTFHRIFYDLHAQRLE